MKVEIDSTDAARSRTSRDPTPWLICGLPPGYRDLWMADDLPKMEGARGLITAWMLSWQASKGMAVEIAHFKSSAPASRSCTSIYEARDRDDRGRIGCAHAGEQGPSQVQAQGSARG